MYPQVFGKYVLERELSRGGMARVLLATLRGAGGFEKRLVVKQIRDELAFDQQFVRRFVEEAKTTVALSHPNIVPVYELGVEQGTYFLAMELVEGVSVAELLRERDEAGARRVLTPEEGAYVGMEVCRALDYAHRRMKVVHRDITPRNVMIDEEGQIKLIDFGIAAPALVAGHEIFGSPGHMPPEQVEGGELGPPTDIFALAVLLMEAWTGSAPFRRATPEECDAAMRGPHPKPSTFDPRLLPLDDAIVRAMMIDPRVRQQEASELGRALRGFLRGLDVSDVARALGDRVRELREAASMPSPPSAKAKSAARATQPSAGEVGTRTFASRGDAQEWSKPPPGVSVETEGPSTRKLADASPADVDKVKRTASGRPRGRPDDPAMAIPTPLMVEPVGDLDATMKATARASAMKEPFADELETIATRPLETPVRAMEPIPISAASPSSRSRAAVAIAIAAIVAIGGVVTWRARTTEAPSDRPAAVPTLSSSPTPTTPVSVASEIVPAPRPPVTQEVAPTMTAAVPSHVASPSDRMPIVAPAGRATVMLLGDPGTRVSIDGTARGACPVRLALEPGQHEAYFTFQPTGESRGERFGVKAGERVTVRADFTGASPTVRIQR